MKIRSGVILIVIAGLMFIAHGAGFVYRTYYTPGFELGVDTLDGVTANELAERDPEIASYVDHLHVNVAALMFSVGLAMMLLAWFGIRNRMRWAWTASIVVPLVFIAISIPLHQHVHFDFDALLHLGPAAVGAPVMIAGAALAHAGLREGGEA